MHSLHKARQKKNQLSNFHSTSFPTHAIASPKVMLHLISKLDFVTLVFLQGNLIIPKLKSKTRIGNQSNKTFNIKKVILNHDFYLLHKHTKLNTFPFSFNCYVLGVRGEMLP